MTPPAPIPPNRGRIGHMSTLALLELLVREAAPVEFEAPVIAARSRGEDPEVIAELERARTLALRVRAILEQRRRREAELSALYETANDLAALHEVDAVLQAIVHRARLLLHSDCAYLSLNDETMGDTYMRVVDGITSPLFRSVRPVSYTHLSCRRIERCRSRWS